MDLSGLLEALKNHYSPYYSAVGPSFRVPYEQTLTDLLANPAKSSIAIGQANIPPLKNYKPGLASGLKRANA